MKQTTTSATLVREKICDGVHSISENDNVIGYLAKTENEELPIGAVLSDGTDLGEFDCPDCAVKEIYRKVHNITDTYLITDIDKKKMALAFLESMLAVFEKRTTH